MDLKAPAENPPFPRLQIYVIILEKSVIRFKGVPLV